MHRGFWKFLGRLSERLPAWVVFGWIWLANLLLLAGMIGFRAVKTSGIAQTFEIQDVPLLEFADLHFPWFMLAFAVTAAFLGVFLAAGWWYPRQENRPFPVSLLWQCGLMWGLGLFACRFVEMDSAAGTEIEPVGIADWLILLLGISAAWRLLGPMARMTERPGTSPLDFKAPPQNRAVRLSVIYLLGCASVAAYAFYEHVKFWDPKLNNGYDFRPFFQPGEVEMANWLLYSTSLLFATIAAVWGCAASLVLGRLSRSERAKGLFFTPTDCRRQALAIAGFWAVALLVPWQIKVLPEIVANDGWILPAVSLGLLVAGLMPLLMAGGLLLRGDFEDSARRALAANRSVRLPKRSEIAFWNLLLFPLYPLLRLAVPRRTSAGVRMSGLIVFTALGIAGLTWFFQKIDQLFEFDDWRGMLKAGLFPCLQVLMSLLAAGWVYLAGSRLIGRFGRPAAPTPDRVFNLCGMLARIAVVAAAFATLGIASWPFWGWRQISENVFARAVEFHNRHEFELRFLHWVFDADRDGYAAVLHGADPDDADPAVQAGGIAAPEVVPVPIDRFEIADAQKAKNFPNVAVFFLEGVTCRAISAYGQRRLPDGLVATPNIDAVAREGTRFTQARCYYPSTWDGWFAVNSGRILRIAEMHAGQSFGDRYSRYNNLYKVLKLAGVNRWCHADTAPFFDLFVPEELKGREATAWKSGEDYSSEVTSTEEGRGIWRGDKRADRIVEFLDSLKPGERFFFCEHMSDTHFPWKRTSDERAAELGFPNGLRIYESDATLPSGGTHEKYKCYLQTITRMDAQIGRILDKLKEKNLYDNTLIVIVGDHGCQWFEHEHMYYVSHLYEQCLRMPMILKVPGLAGNRVSGEPVLQMDIVPTIAEVAGIKYANPVPDHPLTCRSLVPLLKDGCRVDPGRYRNRDMLLCTHYDTLGVVSRFEHKLIFDRPTGTCFVFDLKHDPGETVNLAESRPDLRERLLEKLRFLTRRHASFIGQIAASPEK